VDTTGAGVELHARSARRRIWKSRCACRRHRQLHRKHQHRLDEARSRLRPLSTFGGSADTAAPARGGGARSATRSSNDKSDRDRANRIQAHSVACRRPAAGRSIAGRGGRAPHEDRGVDVARKRVESIGCCRKRKCAGSWGAAAVEEGETVFRSKALRPIAGIVSSPSRAHAAAADGAAQLPPRAQARPIASVSGEERFSRQRLTDHEILKEVVRNRRCRIVRGSQRARPASPARTSPAGGRPEAALESDRQPSAGIDRAAKVKPFSANTRS